MSNSPRPWSDEDVCRAVELRNENVSFTKIARIIGRSPGNVREKLIRVGRVEEGDGSLIPPCISSKRLLDAYSAYFSRTGLTPEEAWQTVSTKAVGRTVSTFQAVRRWA